MPQELRDGASESESESEREREGAPTPGQRQEEEEEDGDEVAFERAEPDFTLATMDLLFALTAEPC